MIDFANATFLRQALTISTGATIIISLIKACGIAKQGIDIWKKKSGEKISPIFFFYNFFYFFVFLLYGIEEKDVALTVNGLLSFVYIPILIGLKKYHTFSEKESYFIEMMSLIIPASFFFDKDKIILVFSVAAAIAIFDQAKKILKEKDFGNLSVRYLQTFLVATILWEFYYLITTNWILGALNIAEIIILITALILERKWRPKQK